MNEKEIIDQAFSMPIHSPSYPTGPYRFRNREYMIITYETDTEKLNAILPAPLELAEPVVKFEFINMPDSNGFGNYCESGQAIPVTYKGESGLFIHAMYLNDHAPIVGGRELWGFPKKLGTPSLGINKETLQGTLDFNGIRVATGTMGFKHKAVDPKQVESALQAPNFVLKIIPHVDGKPRILELVRYYHTDLQVKEAWSAPAALELTSHAQAPVNALPVNNIRSGLHTTCDLTLGLGEVVYDYLNGDYS